MKKEPLILFILCSLLSHLTFVGGLQFFKPTKVVKEEIVIEYIEKPPQPEEKIKEAEKKLQVVESQENPENKVAPKDARFLSKTNNTVEKETRAQNSGEFKNVKPGVKAKEKKVAKAKKPVPQPEKPKKALPTLADLSPDFSIAPVQPDFPEPVVNPTGEGVSQTDDYLKDLNPDIHTMLNTREFVYFSYYSRIRRRLKQYWEPSIKDRVERIFRTGRSIASARDRITKLVIILNKKGQLVGVKLLGKSGIRDLDDAAIEAFRSAAPFPNPPAGIVESDGTIKIRWDFVLEV